MQGVSRLNCNEAIAAITALAFAVTENASAFLAAIFTQLGDTIESILAGNALCGENQRE